MACIVPMAKGRINVSCRKTWPLRAFSLSANAPNPFTQRFRTHVLLIRRVRRTKSRLSLGRLLYSVVDPWQFGTDPYPAIFVLDHNFRPFHKERELKHFVLDYKILYRYYLQLMPVFDPDPLLFELIRICAADFSFAQLAKGKKSRP